MQTDIQEILIDRKVIAQRVAEVARQIVREHTALAGEHDTGLMLVPVLTGSIIFLADLIRHMPLYLRMNMISVTSYPGTATTSRGARLRTQLSDLPDDLSQAHVLVIDDIYDSGQTLALVREQILSRRPASMRTCVFLRKQRERTLQCPVDYVCFDVPDRFVVGYGLDYNGYYRNLPDVVTLRSEAISGARGQDE